MPAYLSESKRLRMLTLCGLYVAQGVPWGFVTVTFAAWLAKPEHKLSLDQIGPMLAVASLPWSFKFVWGPLMDKYTIPRMGRRRPWIIFAQSMAILVLGAMAFIPDLPSMVWTEPDTGNSLLRFAFRLVPGPLAAMILLANIFVSIQDVAVDALAVDLLDEEERGVANGLMYGSSYLGTAIGGAGLGLLVAYFGIRAGLIGQAAILFLIMLLPIMIKERPKNAAMQPSPKLSPESPFSESPVASDNSPYQSPVAALSTENDSVMGNLVKAFSLRATLLAVAVALGVKIGIGVLTAVFVDYLMKDGGWTQENYTTVTGGYAVMLGLGGSALGGFLADRFGAKPMIALTSILLGVVWISFGLIPRAISAKLAVTGLLISQEFILAVLSVSLFSLFMAVSWPRVAATQFTTYMALMNFSTTIGSYTAGLVNDSFNIHQILILAGVLQIVMIAPVLFIDPKQTRRLLGNS